MTKLLMPRFIRPLRDFRSSGSFLVPQTSHIPVLSHSTNVVQDKSFTTYKHLNLQFLPNSQPSWWPSHSTFYKLLGPHFILRPQTSIFTIRSPLTVRRCHQLDRHLQSSKSTTHSRPTNVVKTSSFPHSTRHTQQFTYYPQTSLPPVPSSTTNINNDKSFVVNSHPKPRFILLLKTSMEEAHSAYPGNVTSFNSFDNCTRQGPQIVLRLQTSGCCNSFQHSSKRPEFQFLPRQQTS